jgi:hypothetical protein
MRIFQLRPRSAGFVVLFVLLIASSGCTLNSSSQVQGSQGIVTAYAQSLQRCIGFSPGQSWPKKPGPNPDTMQFCRQLPAWASYEQAQQKFMAQDHAAAAKILLGAAQAGNPLAALRLAIMYDQGDGVALNKREAFRWYLSAAQSREPAAQNETGSFYEDGAVIRQDWLEAAKWYQQSAQSGWSKGQLSLGRAYQYGIGVPLSLQSALDWYSRAAAQGNGQASFFADYIRNNHGFDGSYMSDEEQEIYNSEIGGLPTLGHMVPPPGGRVFHNKAERFSYIRSGIVRILWSEYEACLHGPRPFSTSSPPRTCIQPSVPRPQ